MRARMVGGAALACAALGVGVTGAAGSSGSERTASAAAVSGNVNWCIGKDTSGAFRQVVRLYNRSHPKVNVKLTELPTSADSQRTQLVQRQQAKSSECDVLGLDTIWTAEFTAQGWLRDITADLQKRQRQFIPSTLSSARINGKYWAVPFNTNAGFLYYNKKKVKKAPTTWQQVYQVAKSDGGLGYQGARYEGLTVNFLELLYGAGGSVLSRDGKKATIDSPQAQQVLSLMQKGLKDKSVPRSVLTYMEEESKNAFQTGKISLLRNWPYVYAQAKKAKVNFGLVPLPKWQGAGAASVLGGYNLGISKFSKNPDAAIDFANYVTAPAAQKTFFMQSSLPAVLTQTYQDASVKKELPFAPQLLKAVQQGKPRPVSPVYPQISKAIYDNVYAALSQGRSASSALDRAQDQIERALKTF